MSDHEEIKLLRGRVHMLENSDAATKMRLDDHHGHISVIMAELKTKVAWKHFVWIVGLIFMFMSVILGAIFIQVKENGELSNKNNSAISRVEGVLTGADIKY